MAINDAVHWSTDLGGGTRVALVQAGTFKSDAGTLLGPVPWVLWRPWAEEELADRRLTQALNCLLVETPAGRVLIETGIGERINARNTAMRGYTGTPVVQALREAGLEASGTVDVVAMSHLHYDHAGGLLLADGSKAFPRATIVAQRAEWEIALSDNGRVVASYDQPELRLVRLGRGRLGRGRPGAPGSLRRADGRALRRSPAVVVGPGRVHDPRLLRRPVHAAVVRQPALGDGVRRLPARQRGGQGRTVPPRRGGRLDRRAEPRGADAGRQAGPGPGPPVRGAVTPWGHGTRPRLHHQACVARTVVAHACCGLAPGARRGRTWGSIDLDAVSLRATHADVALVGIAGARQGGAWPAGDAGRRSAASGRRRSSTERRTDPGSQVSTRPCAASLVDGPCAALRTIPSGSMKICVGRAYTRYRSEDVRRRRRRSGTRARTGPRSRARCRPSSPGRRCPRWQAPGHGLASCIRTAGTGVSAWHGGHRVAQKLSQTSLPGVLEPDRVAVEVRSCPGVPSSLVHASSGARSPGWRPLASPTRNGVAREGPWGVRRPSPPARWAA